MPWWRGDVGMGAVLPLALAAVLAAVSGARALPADTKPPATLTTPSTSHTAPPSPPALRAQPLLEEEEDQPHLDYYDEDRINISRKHNCYIHKLRYSRGNLR